MSAKGPKVGDHVVRHAVPGAVQLREGKGGPSEWSIEFLLEGGEKLFVGLREYDDLSRLWHSLERAMRKQLERAQEPVEPFNPDEYL